MELRTGHKPDKSHFRVFNLTAMHSHMHVSQDAIAIANTLSKIKLETRPWIMDMYSHASI